MKELSPIPTMAKETGAAEKLTTASRTQYARTGTIYMPEETPEIRVGLQKDSPQPATAQGRAYKSEYDRLQAEFDRVGKEGGFEETKYERLASIFPDINVGTVQNRQVKMRLAPLNEDLGIPVEEWDYEKLLDVYNAWQLNQSGDNTLDNEGERISGAVKKRILAEVAARHEDPQQFIERALKKRNALQAGIPQEILEDFKTWGDIPMSNERAEELIDRETLATVRAKIAAEKRPQQFTPRVLTPLTTTEREDDPRVLKAEVNEEKRNASDAPQVTHYYQANPERQPNLERQARRERQRMVQEPPVNDQIRHAIQDILHVGEDQESEASIRLKYRELRKWVKIVLDNEKEGYLKMNDARKRVFEQIRDDYREDMDIDRDPNAQNANRLGTIKGNVAFLANPQDGNLEKYFVGIEFKRSMDEPHVEDLMRSIIGKYEGEFRVGEKFELLNEFGEAQAQNFLQWMRERAREIKRNNPNSPINCLSAINIREGYIQHTLEDMITKPHYFQTQGIRISGSDDDVRAELLDPQNHQAFDKGREMMLIEAWRYSISNSRDANMRQIKGNEGKYAEALSGQLVNNEMIGGGGLVELLKLPSTDREEYLKYVENNDQGSVGMAMRKMIAAYYYISELGGKYDTKNVNEFIGQNMFEKVMGPEGMKGFYLSLAADALNNAPKEEYKQFVMGMIQRESDKYNPQTGDSEDTIKKKKNIQQALGKRLTNLRAKNSRDYTVRLDYLQDLEDAKLEAIRIESGRRVEDERRVQIRRDVKNELNANMGEYIRSLSGKSWVSNGKPLEITQADIDRFTSGDYDRFGTELMKRLLAIQPADLNFFDNKLAPDSVMRLVRNAIKRGSAEVADLGKEGTVRPEDLETVMDQADIEYADMWAQSFLYWTGIAAFNERAGVGFDAINKVFHVGDYRKRAAEGRTGGGNRQNIFEIKRLLLNYWEALKVRKVGSDGTFDETLLELLQGGDGDNVNIKSKLVRYEFEGSGEREYADINVGSGFRLLGLLNDAGEVKLNEILSSDQYGNLLVDWDKAQKILDTWWKAIRYTFDQPGYDYNKMIRVREKVSVTDDHGHDVIEKGKVKTKYVYRTMTVREAMLGDRIRAMKMYTRSIHDNKTGAPVKDEHGNIIPGTSDEGDVARNVYAFLMGEEMKEHLSWNTTHHRWSIQTVEELERFHHKFGLSVTQHKNGERVDVEYLEPFFTPDEWDRILGVFNSSYGKLYRTDFMIASAQGFGVGFLRLILAIAKESGKGLG